MRAFSLFPLVFFLGLTACSLMERTDASGYAEDLEMGPSTIEEFYRNRRAQTWNSAREELELPSGRELSEGEVQAVRARIELKRLESRLPSDADKKQYYSLKPFFRNDSERVQFLKLPNKEIRTRWAEAHNITTNESAFDPVITKMIEENDIARGMTESAVRQSWGEPDLVDVAGAPVYGNFRWRYNKLVSTDEGYKNELRIVYFESGRVVGWETL